MTTRKPTAMEGPRAWRDTPRDGDDAPKHFPRKADFIEHLRTSNRPTSKDLRILRAMKKKPAQPDPV